MRKTGGLIPDFGFETLDGARWASRDTGISQFRLLLIYRGMWCPYCKAQLQELNSLHQSFLRVGVETVAVSADAKERAATIRKDYGLDRLSVGYNMPIDVAREMGVFISAGINDIETQLFCEPASFLINAENKIQSAWIASNAFARPSISDIRDYVDFLIAHPNRAPRGSN